MPITDALPDMERELKFFSATNDNPQKLTRAQIRQFNEQGYICPLDVFTPEEAAANRRYFDALMAEAKANGHNSYSINGWHRHCRGIYDLLHEPRILDYVEDLLGPNLVSVMTHYFCKEPGEQKQVVWHQDASYWPLTPSKVVTAWLAIDDVDEENGPMTVVPGSHVHGQIPFEHSTARSKTSWDRACTIRSNGAASQWPLPCAPARCPCTPTCSCTARPPTAPRAAAAA